MTTTFSNTPTADQVVSQGTTPTIFSPTVVSESTTVATEDVTVQLGDTYSYAPANGEVFNLGSNSNLGTITDPLGGGSFNAATNTFTEDAVSTGTPTPATAILDRLVYTPPVMANGTSADVGAVVSVGNGFTSVTDPTNVLISDVTAPVISGTIANEPVAALADVKPFAVASISDQNFDYDAQVSASIIITGSDGTATDADGLLTGAGLSKTGIGTYTISSTNSYSLQSDLQQLSFASTAVAAGTSENVNFSLTVDDKAASESATDTTTSVVVIGPAVAPTPPLIAGVVSDQSVISGNSLKPFNGITISDNNAAPSDSATITLTGGGTLTGAGLVAGATGAYTIAAASPASLTTTLEGLTFQPVAGTSSASLALTITDGNEVANASTTITGTAVTVAPPSPPVNAGGNFTINDETTGTQTFSNGDPYSGPVVGLMHQLILSGTDNLDIAATVPNSFIHSGSGNDAINVSAVNGNNVLDGSTGSNFLVGGTGDDTFFVDDRGPPADVYSTLVNFHSGDNATIFGVDPTSFKLNTLDGQGAAGFTGLDFGFSATGHANANLVLTGFSKADLTNGTLSVSYGTTASTPTVPGSDYMNIHGN
jgi:hypothetical protein